uniref:DNA topoisomerase I n=1 Tax=Tetraselmis sp. GSL018 TaxID=582737 RepID=A0A061REY5_9CHLO
MSESSEDDMPLMSRFSVKSEAETKGGAGPGAKPPPATTKEHGKVLPTADSGQVVDTDKVSGADRSAAAAALGECKGSEDSKPSSLPQGIKWPADSESEEDGPLVSRKAGGRLFSDSEDSDVDAPLMSRRIPKRPPSENGDSADNAPLIPPKNPKRQPSESDSGEDAPLISRKIAERQLSNSEDSEEDAPLMSRKIPKRQPSESGDDSEDAPLISRKTAKRPLSDSEDSEEDKPLISRKAVKREQSSGSPTVGSFFGAKPSRISTLSDSRVKSRSNPEKRAAASNGSRRSVKKEPSRSPSKAPSNASKSGGEAETKWTTLEHGGVMFPPEYEPHGVKMRYDGREVDLTPDEEEVATMFASMTETDYFQKPTFRKNFWEDFREILSKSGKHKWMKDLDKCDFTPIFEYVTARKEKEKAAKKELTSEQKKAAKEEKEKLEAPYKTAIVDGKAEQVGNFRVEPPGLFRGRGEHPKMGRLKKRVYPEDITINIGKEAPVPPLPEMYKGRKWKEIRHDNTVTWLAFWKDPVNSSQFKYVWLAATSSFKTEADREKYEKARMLKDYIVGIQRKYQTLAKTKDYKEAQMGTAMYFIDKLALRAGHEKDDDEADTVGCCNLKVENVELMDDLHIKFDFLGKDSIRYENTVQVEEYVYKNVKIFKEKFGKRFNEKRKKPDDQLFCELDANMLNQFLKEQMPGLSVKVFRTYNASITLDRLLNEATEEDLGTIVDKKIAHYNTANKEVAILCNHQRSVPKTHEASMQRMAEKVEKAEEELRWLERELKAAKAGKATFTKADGKETKPGNPDSLKSRIAKKKEQIHKMEIQVQNKEDLKSVALGTSKINYLDPRITVAWCKRNEVPIEKVFNRSLYNKFLWAMDVEPNYRF